MPTTRSLATVVLMTAAIVTSAWLASPVGPAVWAWASDHLTTAPAGWLAAAVAGLAVYAGYLTQSRRRDRRMVLLVIDDLDRCEGERVVRLLETVHTLLRERSAPRRLAGWREPAPLGVLVLASGAWVRDAFATYYTTFDRRSGQDAVHDLGADFLQKLFDHSVLVPALSPAQTEDLVHVVAGSQYGDTRRRRRLPAAPAVGGIGRVDDLADARETAVTAASNRGDSGRSAPVPPVDAAQGADGTVLVEDGPSSDSHRGRARDPDHVGGRGPIGGNPQPKGEADRQRARDDLGASAQLLVHHLLTSYHAILPGNPRLIIRVTTAWAMLRAVARTYSFEVDTEPASEVLVRAAVMWVRFPVLVDALLDADEPPVVDPRDPACMPQWRRRDVQQVLTMNDGQRVDITALGRCYGRFFAPEVPRPEPAPDPPMLVRLIDAPAAGEAEPGGGQA